MGHLVLLLGGTRSGKSELAERRLERAAGDLAYLATAAPPGDDPAMRARIDGHRARRGPRWTTVEAGADLVTALEAADDRPALVDSVGGWVARFVPEDQGAWPAADQDLAVILDRVLALARARPAETVVVAEEVGQGVHDLTPAGRRFTDLVGRTNRRIADAADEVWLVVAGRAVALPAGTPW